MNTLCDCPTPCACAAVSEFIKRNEKALEDSVGSSVVKKKFSSGWFDEEVREAVRSRREAYEVFRNSNREEDWNEFRKLRSACSRIVRRKGRKTRTSP